MKKSLLALACLVAFAQGSAAQWTRLDTPARPSQLVTTAAPGEVVAVAPYSLRGDLATGLWEPGFSPKGFAALVASPDAGRVLYGLTAGLSFDARQPLWRSVDSGRTWHEMKAALAIPEGLMPGFHSFSPGPFAGGTVYATGANGIFYSSGDGGLTWRVHQGLEDPRQEFCPGLSEVKAHPTRDRAVFVAAPCGLTRSLDAGRSWRAALMDVQRVAVSPRDGAVYAYNAGRSGSLLWESRDWGETWTRRTWSPSGTWELWPDAFEADVLWAGNARELFRSSDRGQTWSAALAPLPGAEALGPAAAARATLLFPSPGTVVAVDALGGQFRWNAARARWDAFRLNGDLGRRPAAFAARDDGVLFFSGPAPGERYRRGGGEADWAFVGRDEIESLVRHAATGEVFAGWMRRARPGGGFGMLPPTPPLSRVMVLDASGAPQPWGPEIPAECELLAVSPWSAPEALLACGNKIGIGTREVGFREIAHALDGKPIAAAWGPDDVVFLATERRIYRGFHDHVADVPAHTVPTSLAAHPSEAGRLFLAHTHGILESRDGGRTWQGFGGDEFLPGAKLSATGDALHAATYVGVFRCAGYRCGGGTGTALAQLVEFEAPQGGRYFLTAQPREIEALDEAGWKRTGSRIAAYRERAPGSTQLRRFFHLEANTHFHAPESDAETLGVRRERGWLEEDTGEVFVHAPRGAGGCATGVPVWRLLGAVAGGFNHRFTTEAAIRDAMVARGWHDEGIRFCAAG